MPDLSTLDMAFESLKLAALKCGDAKAAQWTLHPGSRVRGVPWTVVVPEGNVRSITLADSRIEAERILNALARLFDNYSKVTS